MPPGYRYPLICLLLPVLAVASPNLLRGDGGFEVGGPGLMVRTGLVAGSRRAGLVGEAAEGRTCLRLVDGGDARPMVLEVPWTRLEPGRAYTLSAFLRTSSPGGAARLLVISAEGQQTETAFLLSRDWRRYAAGFAADPAGSGWYRFELHPVAGERRFAPTQTWLDALQLAVGDEASYHPRPALGVSLGAARRLRRAGERVDFGLALSIPGRRRRVPLAWRLEDPFGTVVRAGTDSLDAPEVGAAEATVRVESLPPGAYRLVATATVDGVTLTEDTTVVAASWDLADPVRWMGVEQALGVAGAEAVQLLRIGLDRGVVRDGQADEGRLLANRRAGIGNIGYLPEPEAARAYAAAVAEQVRRQRRLVGTWELPPGLEALPAPRYAELLQAAWQGAREADASAYLVGVRLDATRPAPLSDLRELAGLGAVGATTAVALRLGRQPPEAVGGSGLAAFLGQIRQALEVAGVPRPLVVIASGWPAEPWDLSLAPAPLRLAGWGRVDPLTQAALLARMILLARAGGAAGVIYEGAPQADRAETLTVAAGGLTADLYAADGAPLPAVAALDHALDHLRGRGGATAIALAPGLAAWRWTGRRPLATFWQWRQPGRSYPLELPLPPAELQVTDLFGRPVVPTATARGSRLLVGSAPLYVAARRLGDEEFGRLLGEAVVEGVTPLEAMIVPTSDGVGLALRNGSGRPVRGRLVGGAPFGPLAPGQGTLVPLTTVVPEDRETRLEAAAEAAGETVTAARTVRWLRADGRRVVLDRLEAGEVALPDDLSAWYQVSRQAGELRLMLEVRDQQVTADDAVELWLDPTPTQPFEPGEAQTICWRPLSGSVGSLSGAVLDGGAVAGGYRLTARLPWPGEGAGAEPLGWDVAVHDDDGAGLETRLRWRGASSGAGRLALGWLLPPHQGLP